MRQITRDAVKAFLNNENFKRGNTEVKDGIMYLHGNAIVKKCGDSTVGIKITLAGWNTPTTRERLNGLVNQIGVKVYQKGGTPYLQQSILSHEMDAERWYVL